MTDLLLGGVYLQGLIFFSLLAQLLKMLQEEQNVYSPLNSRRRSFCTFPPCKNSNLLTYLQGILPKDLLGIKLVPNGNQTASWFVKRLLRLLQSNWNYSLNWDIKPHAGLIFSLKRREIPHWSWF